MNILYLLNHKTLSDFELPILRQNGFGIFIPKVYKSLDVTNSINMTNHMLYDDSLINIHKDDLEYLNTYDFFSNKFNEKVLLIIKKNFRIVFLTLLTSVDNVNLLAENITGKIYYRFFGREGELSYVPLMYGLKKTKKINYIFSYNEIIRFEESKSKYFNAVNSYYVPLGIPNVIFNLYENTYNPVNNDFVFVCSKIGKCPYYTNIYNTFNDQLKHIKFTILGKDNENIRDVRIKNNLCDTDYYHEMSTHIAMYYHGQEPRHLHYHPLEAIVIGIPVIFYSKSLLSTYLYCSKGKCNNINEVIDKLNRLKNGDVQLRDDIISYQNSVKHRLRMENNISIFDNIIQCF